MNFSFHWIINMKESNIFFIRRMVHLVITNRINFRSFFNNRYERLPFEIILSIGRVSHSVRVSYVHPGERSQVY